MNKEGFLAFIGDKEDIDLAELYVLSTGSIIIIEGVIRIEVAPIKESSKLIKILTGTTLINRLLILN